MPKSSRSFSKRGLAIRGLSTFLLLASLFLAGCASEHANWPNPANSTGTIQTGEEGDEVSYWNDGVSGGKPKIIIDLNDQRAYFYRGSRTVGVSIVSTGREGYDTPSGEFRVVEKDPTHVSSIYGDYVDRSGQVVVENVDANKDARPRGTIFRGAPMPYFMRIHGGIGMHAGYLPGYPASHGCIRLPKEMAIHFYENAAVGTPVVVRSQPRDEYAPDSFGDESYQPLTLLKR
jgi:lipoprotein-anchoring transpeptidase ErfK/SrfK